MKTKQTAAERTARKRSPGNPYSKLGARLWELRAAKLARTASVAAELGCSTNLILQVERGAAMPTIELLSRWAHALGAAAELPILLALQQEDAQAAQLAGARVKARVMVKRIQAPRSAS